MGRIISGGNVFSNTNKSTLPLPAEGNGGAKEFDNVLGTIGKILNTGNAILDNELIGAIINGIGRATAEEAAAGYQEAARRKLGLGTVSNEQAPVGAMVSRMEPTVDEIVRDLVGNTAGKAALPESLQGPVSPATGPSAGLGKATLPEVRQLSLDRLKQRQMEPSVSMQPRAPFDMGEYEASLLGQEQSNVVITPGLKYADLLVMASRATSPKEAHDILEAVKDAPDIQPTTLKDMLTGRHVRQAEEKVAEVLAKRFHSVGKESELDQYVKLMEAKSKMLTASSMADLRQSQMPLNLAKVDETRARAEKTSAQTASILGPEWDEKGAKIEAQLARARRVRALGRSGFPGGSGMSKKEWDKLRTSESMSLDKQAQEALSDAKSYDEMVIAAGQKADEAKAMAEQIDRALMETKPEAFVTNDRLTGEPIVDSEAYSKWKSSMETEKRKQIAIYQSEMTRMSEAGKKKQAAVTSAEEMRQVAKEIRRSSTPKAGAPVMTRLQQSEDEKARERILRGALYDEKAEAQLKKEKAKGLFE